MEQLKNVDAVLLSPCLASFCATCADGSAAARGQVATTNSAAVFTMSDRSFSSLRYKPSCGATRGRAIADRENDGIVPLSLRRREYLARRVHHQLILVRLDHVRRDEHA